MSEGILARLKVILGIDATQLSSGLNEAQVKTEKTGRKIEGSFKSLGRTFARTLGPLSATGREVSFALQGIGEAAAEANTAFAGLGSTMSIFAGVATGGFLALAGLTVKLFSQIDEQADLAKGIGLSTSQYVQLTSALKLYGIQQEQVTPGLAQFFKIVSGLMRSKAGAEAINELGLSMKSLRLMDTHQQLLAVADAFSKFPDGPKKSAIASQLFTATLGEKMIPLLDQGAAGVEKLEAKYKDLGDESEKLADQTKNLSMQFSEAWSNLSVAALKASGAVGIPTMLLAIAHPLATTKALILDFGHVVAEVFGGVVGGVESLAKAFDSIPGSIAPHIPTAGLDEARRYFSALSTGFQSEAAKAAEPLFGSGETPLKGGGNLPQIVTPDPKLKQLAAYLKSLGEQVAEFGKGETAKGIDKLKELGATQAQIAKGTGLLQQLEYLKAEQKFSDEFVKTQAAMEKTLGKLDLPTAKVDGLADAFSKLTDEIQAAGASALGFKRNTFAGQMQAGVSAGIGSMPAAVPGLTLSQLAALPQASPDNSVSVTQALKKETELTAASFARLAKAFPNLSEAETAALPAGQRMIDQLSHLQKHGEQAIEAFSDLRNVLIMEGSDLGGHLLQGLMGGIHEAEGEMTNLLTGKSFNFVKVAQDLGQSVMGSFISKGVGSVLGKFGLGGAKPDGTTGNPLSVVIVDGTGNILSGGKLGGIIDTFPGGGKGAFNIDGINIGKVGSEVGGFLKNAGGGILGTLGKFAGMFGGFLAGGGDVSPGKAYMVGEKHPEFFMPGVRGRVVPTINSQPGKSPMIYAPTYNISTPNVDSFRKSHSQLITEGYRQAAMAHARNS